MKKVFALYLMLTSLCMSVAYAQKSSDKRVLTPPELKQLANYCDSLQRELKIIYKQELKENSPGKYQPQRIALVRSYLWIFQYLTQGVDVLSISTKDVIKILGKPDVTYQVANYQTFQYNGINKPYLKLKNFNYQLMFNNKQLIQVKAAKP
jgi:hypothetical protein